MFLVWYNSTKDIIAYHKWINNNGFKKSGISIKPTASNFYVKYNKDNINFYLTYTTGNYVPTENYKLDISKYNINTYYNKGNYKDNINWETNNTLKIESSLENNIIQISTGEIPYISTYSGLYKVCAECKNQYLSSFINNNDDKNTLYMLRMDNIFFGVPADDTTTVKKYGDIETLNNAWGTAFWSQGYNSFAQIEPPLITVTGENPSAMLDWKCFCSDLIVDFAKFQADINRR